jgi:hypothetical protein
LKLASPDLALNLAWVALAHGLATGLARHLAQSHALNINVEFVSRSPEHVALFTVDLATAPRVRLHIVDPWVVAYRVVS